jgi:hypothetical protein
MQIDYNRLSRIVPRDGGRHALRAFWETGNRNFAALHRRLAFCISLWSAVRCRSNGGVVRGNQCLGK